MSLRDRGFPSASLLIVLTGTVLRPGVHCQVVSEVRRVRAFVEYHLMDASTPDLRPGVEGWPWRLNLDFVLAFPDVHVYTFAGPCTATVNGAAGHNRGEVAETPPLVRTQGRTVSCSFNVYRCGFQVATGVD